MAAKKKFTEKPSLPKPKSFENGFQVFHKQTQKSHKKNQVFQNKSSKTSKQKFANFPGKFCPKAPT